MLRSRRSSARSAVPIVVLAVAVAYGVAAEAALYKWTDLGDWLPDLVAGLALIASGVYTFGRRRGAGVLLAVTGFAWFLGNFTSALLYAHRGPLVHLFVTFPGWRPPTRLLHAVVGAGYVVSLTSAWRGDRTAILLATGVVAVAAAQFVSARGRARRDRRTALQAATIFGAAVAGGAIVRLAVPSGDAVEPMLLVYEAAIVWISVLFAVRVRPPATVAVADLVVELGESPSGELRDALADVLGDPALQIGYWMPSGAYVDLAGSVVPPPEPGNDRAATYVERDGRPSAVIIHDAAVLDEPALVDAVATATRLGAANAALNRKVSVRLAELTASRRRLVVAADDERRRLAMRLHSGVEERVAELSAVVAEASAGCDGAAGEHLKRAADHLGHTVTDLSQLARGLHPPELDAGLASAVTSLAKRCPVSVEVVIDGAGDTTGEVAAAAYYVCAEALTNVAKHSGASGAHLELSQVADRLFVTIADDGGGGADPANGSGLRGLTDRVEALGGTLALRSPPEGGTRLVVELPLGRLS